MRRLLTLLTLLLTLTAVAETTDRGRYISPLHFGPNAFPVPEMLDGRTSGTLKAEIAVDEYRGYAGDRTTDIFAKIQIPLFTRRVNLSVWMPVCEWYEMTAERQRVCMLQDTAAIRGHGFGDVYVTTDIQVLRARRWWPDITLRAALKTASGEQYEKARHYDDPGYFFDAAIGKSMYIGKDRSVSAEKKQESDWELRIAGMAGFLCWQTVTARQNDAYQYGVQVLVKQQYFSLRATWSGYSGWQKNGDKPMIVKGELRGYFNGWEPFVAYQYGIRDYPFHHVRAGVAYSADIISLAQKQTEKRRLARQQAAAQQKPTAAKEHQTGKAE